eukprot:1987078-Alexandrium_andersonii.AAC.1
MPLAKAPPPHLRDPPVGGADNPAPGPGAPPAHFPPAKAPPAHRGAPANGQGQGPGPSPAQDAHSLGSRGPSVSVAGPASEPRPVQAPAPAQPLPQVPGPFAQMVALPPMPVAAPAAPVQGGPPTPSLAPPPPAVLGAQPSPAAATAPGAMRPDGYILFLIWVGNQSHEVWAHRFWTVQNLITTTASVVGFIPERAALIDAYNGQGFNPGGQLDGVAALTGGAL